MTEAQLRRHVERRARDLGMERWNIVVEMSPALSDDDHSTIATAWPNYEYMDLKIRFHMPVVTKLSAQELDETVVHELLHGPFNELKLKNSDPREEHLVTQIAKTIVRLGR